MPNVDILERLLIPAHHVVLVMHHIGLLLQLVPHTKASHAVYHLGPVVWVGLLLLLLLWACDWGCEGVMGAGSSWKWIRYTCLFNIDSK